MHVVAVSFQLTGIYNLPTKESFKHEGSFLVDFIERGELKILKDFLSTQFSELLSAKLTLHDQVLDWEDCECHCGATVRVSLENFCQGVEATLLEAEMLKDIFIRHLVADVA